LPARKIIHTCVVSAVDNCSDWQGKGDTEFSSGGTTTSCKQKFLVTRLAATQNFTKFLLLVVNFFTSLVVKKGIA
jgi:hypothetical protein